MSEARPIDETAAALQQIADEVRCCTACALHRGRTHAVPGEGPINAEIMFIGEAPGRNEDLQGRPFVGQAGRLLEELLAEIELAREDVFITNVVKCFISPRVKIYTVDGYKPIKDIKIGDLVLTHKGKFRPVAYIRPNEMLPEGSEVVEIVVRPADGYHRKPVRITVTPEHPFMINGRWTPAAEIRAGDGVRVLGDRCQVCSKVFYVHYSRYDSRKVRTCSPTCHNRLIMRSPVTREKVRKTLLQQYAEGLHDPTAITARAHARTRELVALGVAKAQHFSSEERHRARVALAQHITNGNGKHPVGFGEYELQAILEELGETFVEQPAMVRALLERLLKNHRNEYVYVDAVVESATARQTRRDFPLYNIGVEDDESYVVAGVLSHNCRPPDNRDPRPEEIAACAGYLERQIELLRPKVIATLGRYSMEKFFPGARITRVHGKAERRGDRVVIPLFHPAYVLRNMAALPDAKRDMQRIPRLIERLEQVLAEEAAGVAPVDEPAAHEQTPDEPEQLSLF